MLVHVIPHRIRKHGISAYRDRVSRDRPAAPLRFYREMVAVNELVVSSYPLQYFQRRFVVDGSPTVGFWEGDGKTICHAPALRGE